MSTLTATLTGADPGLVGTLTIEVRRASDDVIVTPATTAGIVETAPGEYTYTADEPVGSYVVHWDDGAGGTAEEGIDVADVAAGGGVAAPTGPNYATVAALRAEPGMGDLSDADAARLIADAEDRVDELVVGFSGIDPETGRRVRVADLADEWRRSKLQRATVILAATAQRTPGAFDPPRYASVSGPDFSKSQPIGSGIAPAAKTARRLAAQLLADAGLRLTGARASA